MNPEAESGTFLSLKYLTLIQFPLYSIKAVMDMQNLAQKAIDLSLAAKWEEAIKVNEEILQENPEDVDALNRCARAFAELGDVEKARKQANRVLKIDPVNPIAQKNLEKWKKIMKVKRDPNSPTSFDNDAFLEEPGKTKMVKLLHPGDSKVFANLDPGETVKLVPSAHRLSVTTQDGRYIGRLPDDLAMRLKSLINEGNKYRVLVKSIRTQDIDVFIKEVERGKKTKDINSFPPEKIDYVAFTPPELVHTDHPIAVGEDLEDAEGN